MGEIAEDMIDGTCCAICGCYFADEENMKLINSGKTDKAVLYTHGYPVACSDCYEEGCGYEEAEVDTI